MMTLAEILAELRKMPLSEKQTVFNSLELELKSENNVSGAKRLEREFEGISETIIKDKEAQ